MLMSAFEVCRSLKASRAAGREGIRKDKDRNDRARDPARED